MAELFDLDKIFNRLNTQMNDISKSLDIPSMEKILKEKESNMSNEDFWQDENSKTVLREIKIIKGKLSKFYDITRTLDDMSVILEMLHMEMDALELENTFNDLKQIDKQVNNFTLETLLNGKYDSDNAILSIHPGAGGTESQDWAQMLFRMFVRFAEKNDYKVKVLDELSGDVAGIKSVTLLIEGINAYGFLKSEKGVHRLVRLSPFDSNNRRHTSFASVDVMPEINNDVELEINPKDLKIDTYRSGGAGGQHVNKTDSAVRITHLPTKIVVSCQNERSQFQNKETAMKILKARLIEIMEAEQKEKLSEIQGDYGQIAWGNQIRSYVFHPYSMVKDHRTKCQTSNVSAVMDGDIFEFIDSYLKENAKGY